MLREERESVSRAIRNGLPGYADSGGTIRSREFLFAEIGAPEMPRGTLSFLEENFSPETPAEVIEELRWFPFIARIGATSPDS